MKRIIITAIVLLFCTLTAISQKPDLKGLKITFMSLPLKPLHEEIKTYESDLIISITDEKSEIEKLKNQYLKLQGYTKATDATGDVIIIAKFDEFKVKKEMITKDVYNVNQAKNMTGYYYNIICEYPVSLTLKGKDGNILFEEIISHKENLMSFEYGKWTYSINELENKFNAEKKEKLSEIKNKCDKNALSNIKKTLLSNFSYAPLTKKIKIATGKSKKHDYSDLDKALEHMQKAFEIISDQNEKNDHINELNHAIEIWEKALKGSSGDKKARINTEITIMLNYNICIASWWLKDFSKAFEYAETALKLNSQCNKPSTQYEKMINEAVEDIKDYKNRLEIHGKI